MRNSNVMHFTIIALCLSYSLSIADGFEVVIMQITDAG